MSRISRDGEVGENLADHRGELESVSGEPASNAHRCKLWMLPDDKVFIRGQGVHAGLCFQNFAIKGRKARPQLPDYLATIDRVNYAVYGFGDAFDVAAVNRGLNPSGRTIDSRKSIDEVAVLR